MQAGIWGKVLLDTTGAGCTAGSVRENSLAVARDQLGRPDCVCGCRQWDECDPRWYGQWYDHQGGLSNDHLQPKRHARRQRAQGDRLRPGDVHTIARPQPGPVVALPVWHPGTLST